MRYLAATTCTLLSCWGLCACEQTVAPALDDQTGGAVASSSNSTNTGGATSTANSSSGGTTSGQSGTTGEQGGTGYGSTVPQGGSKASGGTSARTGGTSAKGGTSSTTGGTTAKGGASTNVSSKASGGATSVGGASTGGTSKGGATGVGGVTGLGGVTSKGGASATGGFTATGGVKATGGTTGGGLTLPKITNGQNGTTTRYWDCCMPSCSWKANAGGKNPVRVCDKGGVSFVSESNRNACDGGSGFMCYWGVPWSMSSTVSYGYAAHNGAPCGTCFQLDFTSGSANGKSMIVQVINIGGLSGNQFDLLIPGGGVGAMNACNANGNMWNGLNLGEQFGGLLRSCNNDCNCMKQKCQSTFGNNSTMLAGCNWFTDWFQCADNPNMVYKQTSCPSELVDKSGISG